MRGKLRWAGLAKGFCCVGCGCSGLRRSGLGAGNGDGDAGALSRGGVERDRTARPSTACTAAIPTPRPEMVEICAAVESSGRK